MPLKARAHPAASVIELARGDFRAALAPEFGGAILNLSWRGRDLLRPTAPGTHDPMQAASFPLAPYVNRIANGRFSFGGRTVALDKNYPTDKHPLHGVAWLMPWRVEEASAQTARLALDYEPGEWPWAFQCTQTISLERDAVRLELTLRNASDTPMPASFGFHPAFVRPKGARLAAKVTGVWRVDSELLPTHFDQTTDLPGLAEGATLDGAPHIDQCHAGWDGKARLSTPEADIEITASPTFGFLHLYVPVGADYLCIEPVSAMPDAMNRTAAAGHGLLALAPGEAISGWMRIAPSKPRG